MIPPPFEYRAPDSIPEALALLREYGDEARLMAGGQSLLPMLKLRLIRPRVIIDIGRLRELTDVTEDADSVRIGALVTERTLERTFLNVSRSFPRPPRASATSTSGISAPSAAP